MRWRRAWRTWRPVSRGLDVALGDAHLPRLEPRRHRITRSVKQGSRGASRSAGPTASTSRVPGHARAHRSAGETGGRALRRSPPCSGPRAPGRAAPPRRHLAGARTTRMARPQAERYTLPPAGSIFSSPPRFPAAQRGKRPPHVDEQERRRGGLDLPPSSRDRGEGRWRLGRASAGAVVDAEADVSIDLGRRYDETARAREMLVPFAERVSADGDHVAGLRLKQQ